MRIRPCVSSYQFSISATPPGFLETTAVRRCELQTGFQKTSLLNWLEATRNRETPAPRERVSRPWLNSDRRASTVGHNSGRARTFRFSEGVNGFFSAANCDFYLPLSHWIPQRSLSQVASDRLHSFFVHHTVARFFELSRLEFAFPRLLQRDPGSYCRRLNG